MIERGKLTLTQPYQGGKTMIRPARRAFILWVGVFWVIVSMARATTLRAADVPVQSASRGLAQQILEESGIKGGLVVHLGCGDGELTAALRADDRYLVQGLDADAARVEKAREHIRSLGVYGAVSAERLTGAQLPYAENLVNLVVADDLGQVPMDEVMRVLAPGGVVCVRQGDGWKKSVKPYPKTIDEWTHYLHDASGNAVAADSEVGPPRYMRWTAGPIWSRSHEFNPSINALVIADGRMFYILDEGMIGLTDLRFPARWALYARDAFSGKFLWKRPIPNWGYREWNTRGMWSAPLTLNRRVVTDGKRVFATFGYKAPVTVLDAATGDEICTLAGTLGTDEMILSDGVLLACVRGQLSVALPPKTEPKNKLNPHEYAIGPPAPAAIVALDVESDKELWRSEPQPVVVLTLAALGGRICYSDRQEIVCLDLATGRKRWSTACRAPGGNRHAGGTLVMHDDVVLFTAADGLTAFSAEDGHKLWTGPKVSGPGITHPPDLFVAAGLVWSGDEPGMNSRERTAVRRDGRDPKTGEIRRTVEVPELFSPLHHVRCYRSKATDRYLMLTKRGVEFLDLEGHDHMRNDWLRAMCHYGFAPANGLLYVPPSHCFCYPGVKMTGFLALAANRRTKGEGGRANEEGRLEKGPAFDQASARLSTAP
jgi:outer membrane protein assembly factor BamB